MSFSVEILAEHPDVVHLQKILLSPVNVAIESEITSPFSVGDELNVDLCICHFE